MKQPVRFRINGSEEEVYIEPWWTLANVLRNELGLTSVKVGCDTGYCGVCTVLIDGKAVKSCMYPAMKAQEKQITTVEGLRDKSGELHPLQESFIGHFAIQCGYCTPGMILVAKALLDENPNPSEEEIKEILRGNLCRCTGYTKIVEAIRAVKK